METLWSTAASWKLRLKQINASPLARLVDTAQEYLKHEQSPAFPEAYSLETRSIHFKRLQALTVIIATQKDQTAADEAYSIIDHYLEAENKSDLGRASAALNCVTAFSTAKNLWDSTKTKAIEEKIFQFGLAFRNIQNGNPDNPFNNWWGVTHSAAGLCFLATLNSFERAQSFLEEECDKIASYILNYGDAGHYYEGTGYGAYSFCQWAPFVLACRHTLGKDLAKHAPGIARIGENLSILTVPTEQISNSDQPLVQRRLGRRVFWNDDGGGFVDASIASLYFPFAEESKLNGLLSSLNKLAGVEGDQSLFELPGSHGHPLWTLLYYPLNISPVAYGENLPVSLYEHKTGLTVFRNSYSDENDIVFAVYPKTYHGGGHAQEDAGSFRLLGLGSSWAHAGGQAKPQPQYQNVPLKNGLQKLPKTPHQVNTGKVCFFKEEAHKGGAVSVDLSAAYRTPRMVRHYAVKYAPVDSIDAVIAVWDEVINENENDTEWGWPLCYDQDLKLHIESEDNAFLLKNPTSGASLNGRIHGEGQYKFEKGTSPSTKRKYSNGSVVNYPGVPYFIATTTGGTMNTFAVMTLQMGTPSQIEFSETGLEASALINNKVSVKLTKSRWFNGPLSIECVADNE